MDRVLLKDLRYENDGGIVFLWDYIDTIAYRIYYKRIIHDNSPDDKVGFTFYCADRTSFIDSDTWNGDTDECECIFQGTAYFDGIRHLYYGSDQTDNYGYHYYANLSLITDALVKLQELEDKFCRDI